jgi:hypothetical protein
MKFQITTLVFAFLLSFLQVQGQLALRPYMGINTSQLTNELLESTNLKTQLGYQIGLDLQLGDRFYVQPGLQFESLSNSNEATSQGDDIDLVRTYLRLPIMVGYAFGGAESMFGFRVFTGLNAAISLGGNVDGRSGILQGSELKDELENLIFGWNAGAGINFLSIFFVDMGYQIGLTDVFKNIEGLNSGVRNNLFYANAGIRARF